MNNCCSCAYGLRSPGDAHYACRADFKAIGAGLPQVKLTPWSRMFPLNFDPTWVSDCPAWSEKADHVRANADDPLSIVLGILGGAGRL